MKQALLILFLATSHTAFAEDGKALHEAYCIGCHSRMTGGDGHVIYTRDDRIVRNMDQLQARVAHCSKGSNTAWRESEINTVTQYLNDEYYHY